MTTSLIVGYVCVDCEKISSKQFCHFCNDYKNLIPITQNIVDIFQKL